MLTVRVSSQSFYVEITEACGKTQAIGTAAGAQSWFGQLFGSCADEAKHLQCVWKHFFFFFLVQIEETFKNKMFTEAEQLCLLTLGLQISVE